MIRVMFSDIDWLQDRMTDIWKAHGEEWNLRETMDFLYHFEDRLHEDWHDLTKEYERDCFREYYEDGRYYELDDFGRVTGYRWGRWYYEVDEDGNELEEYRLW